MTNAALSNNPPTDEELIRERLSMDYGSLIERQAELLEGVPNVPEVIETEEDCEKVADYLKQMKIAAKEADGFRADEKEPHNLAGKTIQAWFKDLGNPLTAYVTKFTFRIKTYHDKKLAVERIKREEAEHIARAEAEEAAKKAREAEEAASNDETLADAVIAAEAAGKAQKDADKATKAASASSNVITKVKSASGVTTSMSTFMNFRNLNMATIDLDVLRPFISQDVIEKAIRAAIRNEIRNINGVEIFEDTRSRVR